MTRQVRAISRERIKPDWGPAARRGSSVGEERRASCQVRTSLFLTDRTGEINPRPLKNSAPPRNSHACKCALLPPCDTVSHSNRRAGKSGTNAANLQVVAIGKTNSERKRFRPEQLFFRIVHQAVQCRWSHDHKNHTRTGRMWTPAGSHCRGTLFRTSPDSPGIL